MEPEFRIKRASIRYNPREGDSATITVSASEDKTLILPLTLLGWTPENASIEACYFQHDKSLPPGSILIAPLPEGLGSEP